MNLKKILQNYAYTENQPAYSNTKIVKKAFYIKTFVVLMLSLSRSDTAKIITLNL